jgi:hypothetical protein
MSKPTALTRFFVYFLLSWLCENRTVLPCYEFYRCESSVKKQQEEEEERPEKTTAATAAWPWRWKKEQKCEEIVN